MDVKRITKRLQSDNTLLPAYSQVIFFLYKEKTEKIVEQYLVKKVGKRETVRIFWGIGTDAEKPTKILLKMTEREEGLTMGEERGKLVTKYREATEYRGAGRKFG